MNNRAVTLSLAMAAFAVFFVYSYVESVKDEVKNRFGDKMLVVKAKRDIKEQETVVEEMLTLEVVPQQFLEPGALKMSDSDNENDKKSLMKKIFGSIAVVPIRKGEQITFNKLTEPGVRTGLAPQIAPGRRAIAVSVNDNTGVARLIKPGDRVDLIAVIDTGNGKEGKIAKTILQDVVVLSAGKSVTNNAARIVELDPYTAKEKARSLSEDVNYGSVTLEVEPSQAQSLALVMANGENAITLVLRNNDDTAQAPREATTLPEILGSDLAKVPRRLPAGGMR